eukprot:3062146-Prymnesium_polylepis.1
MVVPPHAWRDAAFAAAGHIADLDEEERQGMLDVMGGSTWKLYQFLREKMPDQRLPFENRHAVRHDFARTAPDFMPKRDCNARALLLLLACPGSLRLSCSWSCCSCFFILSLSLDLQRGSQLLEEQPRALVAVTNADGDEKPALSAATCAPRRPPAAR